MNREELLKNAKPILFNTEMVQAILEGRKTVTRRVVKYYSRTPTKDGKDKFYKDALYYPLYFKVGDILYIRETWRDRWGMAYANYGTGNAYPIDDVREIEYKTCGNGYFMRGCNLCPNEPTVVWDKWSKWKPSIHMPREAARIFLKVTDVRVERLQDITPTQCLKEGCNAKQISSYMKQLPFSNDDNFFISHRLSFQDIWDSTIKKQDLDKYSWEANPWVWVIEFERVEVNNE